MKRLLAFTFAIVSYILATQAHYDDDDVPFPDEGPEEKIPHIIFTITLPKQGNYGDLLTNDQLNYEFRKVIAGSSGDDPDENSQYALLMEWTDGDTQVSTPYSIADTFNRYPQPAVGSRRLSSMTTTTETLPSSSSSITDSLYSMVYGTPSSRKLQSGHVVLKFWYLFGHDFYHINEAATLDGQTIGQTMITNLQNSASWTSFLASTPGSTFGITASVIASSVDANSLEVSMPKLRYKPEAFGNLEGTALGSLLGIVVFVIAVFFIAVPGLIEKYRNKQNTANTGKAT